MIKGLELSALRSEVNRVFETKVDRVINSAELMTVNCGQKLGIYAERNKEENYYTTDYANQQMAECIGMPKKYFDKCYDGAKDLLCFNLNFWFRKNPALKLIRALDGNVRAFLSDRYRIIDNKPVLDTVLNVAEDHGLEVKSTGLTPTKMYLQMLFPKIQGEIRKGDVVQLGLVVSNSEVGAGSVRIEPMLYRLVCENGLITADSLKKYHVHRGYEEGEDFFSNETIELSEKVFLLKIRDLVKGVLDTGKFEYYLEKMRRAAGTEDKVFSKKFFENFNDKYLLSEKEGDAIFNNLIKGADFTQYGLINAVTASANQHTDYDRAIELERLGGKLLNLEPKDWALMN